MSDTIAMFERIDDATLTASAGSDASYPLTNLQDGRYSTYWKSAGTTAGQTLTASHGSRAVNSVLIANHNLASLGLTSIEVLNDVDNVIGTITTFPAVIYATFASDTTDYTKLRFNKGSALSAAPQIGMFFTGKSAVLPITLNNPKRGLKVDIVRDESLSGLKFRSAALAPRQTWKLDYGALKAIDNSEFYRWFNGISVGLHPFWFRDIDGNWHFIGADIDAIEGGIKGNVAFDFKGLIFSEERVGTTIELPGGYTV